MGIILKNVNIIKKQILTIDFLIKTTTINK